MSAPGRRTVQPWEYNTYIQSPEWRAVRERYWTSKLPKRCWVCDTPRRPGFHLHHRTYKNLGAERLMDLVPVCSDCHQEIHRRCPDNRGLWGATKAVKRDYMRKHDQYEVGGNRLVGAGARRTARQAKAAQWKADHPESASARTQRAQEQSREGLRRKRERQRTRQAEAQERNRLRQSSQLHGE
jgi:hypothetical protein